MNEPLSARSIAFGVSLFLPAIYVLVSNYLGLNAFIADWAQQSGIQWASLMPLSTEYLVFAVLFCVTVYFCHGISGLKDFSVPVFFMVIVGTLYTIDNVFPYGQFTPLQFFVPTTTWFAARTLGLIGYNVTPGIQRDSNGSLPLLTVADPNNPAARSATFAIAWPCAGIESFLIFAVVVLLFLKRMPISWKAKTGYFAIGAAVTYFINILRIVTIFTIGVNYGESSEPVQLFHYFYGPLYSVAWIISYPLIIIVSQSLWHKIQTRNTIRKI
jgi:exosortase/archaeosortase family protein